MLWYHILFFLIIFAIIIVYIIYLAKNVNNIEKIDNFLLNLFPAVPSASNIEISKEFLKLLYISISVIILLLITLICTIMYQTKILKQISL